MKPLHLGLLLAGCAVLVVFAVDATLSLPWYYKVFVGAPLVAVVVIVYLVARKRQR